MTKRKTGSSAQRAPDQLTDPRVREQRRAVRMLQEEIDALADLSLMIMEERGILPPFYGGSWLDDDTREILPLLGVLANDEEELGLIMLRLRPGVERNRDLRQARRDSGMANTWPFDRLLHALGPQGQPLPIEGGETLRGSKIAFALFGEQCFPAPGYTKEGMIAAIEDELPIALFVHVPVIGDGDFFGYAWAEIEHFRAEILYAETDEELEMAVWRYRLDLAMADENFVVDAEAAVEPETDQDEEDFAYKSVADLVGFFDLAVMDAQRFYGVTSAIQDKQKTLDVLRGLGGDLVINAPLRTEIEPVKLLAEMREAINGDAAPDKPLISIDADSKIMTETWPQVRAHSHFCMRYRRGEFTIGKNGQPRMSGFNPKTYIEWIVADSLDELYSRVTLQGLRQLLAVTGKIKVAPRIIGGDEPSAAPDGDHA